jgi:hypothetical protein
VRLGVPGDKPDVFTGTTRVSLSKNANNDVHPKSWKPAGGDCNNAPDCQRTVFSAKPGIEATAPKTPGVYKTEWQLLDENRAWFGPQMWLSFNVVECPDSTSQDGGVHHDAGPGAKADAGSNLGREPQVDAGERGDAAANEQFPEGAEEGVSCTVSPGTSPARDGACWTALLLGLAGLRLRARSRARIVG